MIEALSELRLLAVAKGDYLHSLVSGEQAHHYLTQVMALNLWLLFSSPARRSGKPRDDWRGFHAICSITLPSVSATSTSSIS